MSGDEAVRADLFIYDGPDGGAWLGTAPSRSIDEEFAGVPDTRVARFVLLDAEMRYALGRLLLDPTHVFGSPPPMIAPD